MNPKPTCSVDGCVKPSYIRELCKAHYNRAWRRGRFPKRGTIPRSSDFPCSEPDCDHPAYSKGICRKHYNRQYRQTHRDELAQRNKEWRARNRQHMRVYSAEKRANDPRVAAYQERYRTEHRDRLLEQARAYYHSHRDEIRAKLAANAERDAYRRALRYAADPKPVLKASAKWRAKNPEKVAAQARLRQARIRAQFVEHVDLTVLAERDKGICGICNKHVGDEPVTIDHIVHVYRGGEHSYANTRLAHLRCNLKRGRREVPILPV